MRHSGHVRQGIGLLQQIARSFSSNDAAWCAATSGQAYETTTDSLWGAKCQQFCCISVLRHPNSCCTRSGRLLCALWLETLENQDNRTTSTTLLFHDPPCTTCRPCQNTGDERQRWMLLRSSRSVCSEQAMYPAGKQRAAATRLATTRVAQKQCRGRCRFWIKKLPIKLPGLGICFRITDSISR